MAIVENGVYVVNAADVALAYKTDIDAVPPSTPAIHALTIIPRGVGKPQSPQLRFDDPKSRDDFYKKLVIAMGEKK